MYSLSLQFFSSHCTHASDMWPFVGHGHHTGPTIIIVYKSYVIVNLSQYCVMHFIYFVHVFSHAETERAARAPRQPISSCNFTFSRKIFMFTMRRRWRQSNDVGLLRMQRYWHGEFLLERQVPFMAKTYVCVSSTLSSASSLRASQIGTYRVYTQSAPTTPIARASTVFYYIIAHIYSAIHART